jgi:hypothetical protein
MAGIVFVKTVEIKRNKEVDKMAEQKICQKCGKMMDANTKFYTYKNGEKTEMCKNCLTMHIDNFDPETYL